MKYLQYILFAPRSVGRTAPQSCCVARFLHIANTNSQLPVTIRLDITLNNLRITRFELTQNSNCVLDRNTNSFLGSGWTDFEGNSTTIFIWIRTSYLLGILNRLQYSASATCLTCEVKMLPSNRGDPFVLPLVLIVEISSYVQPLPRKKYLFVKYLITLHQIEMKWQNAYGEQEMSQSFKGKLQVLWHLMPSRLVNGYRRFGGQ
jgi:hypothetical protein